MAEKKIEQAIKAPTEKQVSLLEKLMAHELEDVQQKALAIVLSIWKKKTVQEISYIIPNLTEKQIRYTIKRYRANPTEDRKSTRLNSSHSQQSRMPSSA